MKFLIGVVVGTVVGRKAPDILNGCLTPPMKEKVVKTLSSKIMLAHTYVVNHLFEENNR